MARWTLQCEKCNFPFTHSYIYNSNILNFFEPSKPEIPYGGEEHECPNCGHKETYMRHELVYQA
jgi:hypothetical protein